MKSKNLKKKLKPVTLNQYGLYTIVHYLGQLNVEGKVTYTLNKKEYSVDGIQWVIDNLKVNDYDTVEYFEFDYDPYYVRFPRFSTRIEFEVVDDNSIDIFNKVTDFLEGNQNYDLFASQFLNFLDKPKRKSFLLQTSIPNYVYLIVQFITLGIAIYAVFK